MATIFPHLTATGPAPTAYEIYSAHRQAFHKAVSNGLQRPFIFPYNFLSFFVVVAYLCIPHQKNSIIYAARWPLIGIVTLFEIKLIRDTRGLGMGGDLNAGAVSAITLLISWTWLIFRRPQWDAKRVERRRVRVVNDVIKAQISEKSENNTVPLAKEGCSQEKYEYFWQSYPENFIERISWVMDLFLNGRGPGWNWSSPTIPKLTPEVLSKLEEPAPGESISLTAKKHLNARFEHLFSRLSLIIPCLLADDVMRTIMMKDPYFKFGPTTYDLPSYLQPLNPSALQFYRLLLASLHVVIGMILAFNILDLFQSCLLGPRVLGLRGEVWYYPNAMGRFSHIFEKGLNGLWGGFWHQTFRNFFTAPTKYLIKGGYIKPGSFATKMIGLVFAFGLSAFLHWAPSVTSILGTQPVDQALFFLLQGAGVALQDCLCKIFSPLIIKLPTSIRKTGNFLYTFTWLYFTGSFAANDFARNGVWLVKPLPFSLMETLGFGELVASENHLNAKSIRWFTGKYWWENGIALM